MKKSNLLILSGLLLAGATATAVYMTPKDADKETPEAQSRPVNQATLLDNVRRVTSPMREDEVETPRQLPLVMQPTAEQFAECYVQDVNNDNKTWTWAADKGGAFKYSYHGTNDADDWVFLPLVSLQEGVVGISYDVWAQSNTYAEKYEAYLMSGRTPDDIVATLKVEEGLTETAPVPVSIEYTVENPGNYYLAFHASSDADKYYLFIQNVKMVYINGNTPQSPTINSINFEGTEGNINITAPSLNVSGGALPDSFNLVIECDNQSIEGSPFTCSPAEVKDIPLTLPEGMHTISAYASLEDNGLNLSSEMVSQSVKVTRLYPLPMAMPVYMQPDEVDADHCLMIDNNTDSHRFTFEESRYFAGSSHACFFYTYNSSKAADDWLILPAMEAAITGPYRLIFDIGTNTELELIDIYAAEAPTIEAMLDTDPILPMVNYSTSNSWKTENTLFIREAGQFYIGIHVKSASNHGNICFKNIKVKFEDPRIPVSPTLDFDFDGFTGDVNVTMPTETIDGSTITAATVNASLKIFNKAGEQVDETVVSGAPGETVSYNTTLEKGQFTATTYAYYQIGTDTFTSDPYSQVFIVTLPSSYFYTLPFSLPMTQEEFDDMVVVDANNDDKTWTYDTTTHAAKYSYHGSNSGDDWLISTVPINFPDASKTYRISMNLKSSGTYPESVKVFLGTSPEIASFTTEIFDLEEFKFPEFTTEEQEFNVQEAGNYYFAFYCYSPKNKLNLLMKDIVIEVKPAETSPGQVTDLVVVPDATGANQAHVMFTMPVNDRAGNPLPADQELTATVTATPTVSRAVGNSVTVTGLPGQQMDVAIATAPGDNQFVVSINNSDGVSPESSDAAYIGLDIPLAPQFTSINLSEDGYGVELAWDAVTEGVNGGAVNAPAMQYQVSEYVDFETWSDLATVAATDYEFRVAEGTPQDMHKVSVRATNGESNFSARSAAKEIVCGKPYEPVVDETFADNEITYTPLYSISTHDVLPTWTLGKPGDYVTAAALEDDQEVLVGAITTSYEAGLVLPLMSTVNAENATFSIEVFSGLRSADMDIYVSTYGTERVLLGSIPAGENNEWATYSYTLPEEMLNRPWIEIMIDVDFNSTYLRPMIRSYKLDATIVNGVQTVTNSNVNVFSTAGTINIQGAAGKNVVISDLSGKRIYAGEGRNNMTVSTAKGIHIVTVDGKAYKLMVR